MSVFYGVFAALLVSVFVFALLGSAGIPVA